jgi:hypothetical protein
MAGLAIVALLLAGWRKNARATTPNQRGTGPLRRPWEPIGVAETTTPLYKRAGIVRRLWALLASTGMVIVFAVVIATITAFGLAFVVTTLTSLLKR